MNVPVPIYPDLEGKTAIVTGSSRGIGCGIAWVLGKQGMNVVLTARSEDKGLAFQKKLEDEGINSIWVTADVSSKEDAKKVIQTCLDTYGTPYLLVNNAAIQKSKPFSKMDEEAYVISFEKNMRLMYELSLPAALLMKDAGEGAIVNISSVGGIRAHNWQAGYDAYKGAMNSLTRSMAVDLASDGIRVNAVAPGAIHSRWDREQRYKRDGRDVEHIPIPRVGEAEEIGNAVAFFASRASGYTTGQILHVDGGLTSQLTPKSIII